jgi:hypothetical protein
MNYSLPAWLGAFAGMLIAVAIYIPCIRWLDRRMRAQDGPKTVEEREAFEEKVALVRRSILGVDVAILATLGYWIGKFLSDSGAPRAFH